MFRLSCVYVYLSQLNIWLVKNKVCCFLFFFSFRVPSRRALENSNWFSLLVIERKKKWVFYTVYKLNCFKPFAKETAHMCVYSHRILNIECVFCFILNQLFALSRSFLLVVFFFLKRYMCDMVLLAPIWQQSNMNGSCVTRFTLNTYAKIAVICDRLSFIVTYQNKTPSLQYCKQISTKRWIWMALSNMLTIACIAYLFFLVLFSGGEGNRKHLQFYFNHISNCKFLWLIRWWHHHAECVFICVCIYFND